MIADPKAEEIMQALCPRLAEDVLMALRLCYYCQAKSLIPDPMYDLAQREYLNRPEVDEFDNPIEKPGSDVRDHYSPRVRALAAYLLFNKADQV